MVELHDITAYACQTKQSKQLQHYAPTSDHPAPAEVAEMQAEIQNLRAKVDVMAQQLAQRDRLVSQLQRQLGQLRPSPLCGNSQSQVITPHFVFKGLFGGNVRLDTGRHVRKLTAWE